MKIENFSLHIELKISLIGVLSMDLGPTLIQYDLISTLNLNYTCKDLISQGHILRFQADTNFRGDTIQPII